MSKLGWIAVVALLLGVVACGSEAAAPLSEDEFCEAYATRECAKVAPLCSLSPEACRPARVSACRAFAQRSRSETRSYRPANIDPCLAKVSATYARETITAADLAALEDTCARVFQGDAALNDACGVDYDCGGALVCDKGRCGNRKIVARDGGCANVGEICPGDQFCSSAPGLYLCLDRAQSGMPCGASQPCQPELRCAGRCAERLGVGAGCEVHDDCSSGMCDPHGLVCATGLRFATGSPSCLAFGAAVSP